MTSEKWQEPHNTNTAFILRAKEGTGRFGTEEV